MHLDMRLWTEEREGDGEHISERPGEIPVPESHLNLAQDAYEREWSRLKNGELLE